MGFALKLRHAPQGRNRRAGEAGRGNPRSHSLSRAGIRASCPAASASAWPWAVPLSAPRQVFLFDEPLSNLDAKLRVQMRAEIKELHQRLKTTTVYVTHDQVEAMTMADKYRGAPRWPRSNRWVQPLRAL